MKILMLMPSLGKCNGITSYVINYYKELKKKYSNITIDFALLRDEESEFYEYLKSNGSIIFILPSFKKYFSYKKSIEKIIKDSNYDVVHCHMINSGFVFLKVAKKYNVKKRILHSHTTSNGDSLLKRLVRFLPKKLSLYFANQYLACSYAAGKYLFKNRKFEIINNAISVNESRANVDKIYNAGTVGRFTKQKNPFFIVDIIKECSKMNPNFKFVWIGDGELKKDVLKKLSELNLTKNVIFTGIIDNVIEYYSKMEVFILPSKYEGLPVVGVEAQVNEIPCIFSNKITEEILINDNTIMLSINNPKAWAIKIFEMYGKTPHQNVAKDKYDISTNVRKLYMEYEG